MYDRFQAFTVTILEIYRCIQRIKTEEVSELELKAPHVSCLYYLSKERSLTAKKLCEICREDKSYVSHSLRYLEEKGYISCDSDAKKRYNAPLCLTDEGRRIACRITEKIDSVLEKAGEGLTAEERSIMYRSLDTVSANLEKICEKYSEGSLAE